MKTAVILLLATLAAANAMERFFTLGDYEDEMGKVGNGCCLPLQWEGRVGAVHITKRFLRPKVRASDSKIGLDFAGQKVAARSMFYCAKAKKVFEARTVADYNAKKAYFIFKDKCKAFSLRRPLNKPCIPDTFRRFPPYFYGADSSSLFVTPFGYRNGSLAVFSVVTRDSCVPVKGAYKVTRGRHSSMGTYQYFNITLGNTDRDLYSVPASCNRTSVTSVKNGLWRKFRNFIGETPEEPFNPNSQLGDLVDRDAMSHMMDLVDSNAMMLMAASDEHEHKSSSRHQWFQRGRESRRND